MSLPGNWIAATIATTTSGVIDLGRPYDYLDIQIPTATSCTIKIQVSEQASGTTWYDLGDGVTTAAGTHGYADVFKLGGWQFIKIVPSTTQSNLLVRVRGMAI